MNTNEKPILEFLQTHIPALLSGGVLEIAMTNGRGDDCGHQPCKVSDLFREPERFDPSHYRIAPTPRPTHEPYTRETVPVGREVVHRVLGTRAVITYAETSSAGVGLTSRSYETLYADWKHPDGSPCGVEVKRQEPERYFLSRATGSIWKIGKTQECRCKDAVEWDRYDNDPERFGRLSGSSDWVEIPAHEALAMTKGGAK